MFPVEDYVVRIANILERLKIQPDIEGPIFYQNLRGD
jgi:hypothetical protein